MKITLTKKNHRSRLTCERSDGSVVSADLGPRLPYHDLAHYVAERSLRMSRGFFGNIERGYSIDELSDKDVIESLGEASMQAEVVARAVGALATGACRPEQFEFLVNSELLHLEMARVEGLGEELASHLLNEFNDLVATYAALEDGESMVLEFDLEAGDTP